MKAHHTLHARSRAVPQRLGADRHLKPIGYCLQLKIPTGIFEVFPFILIKHMLDWKRRFGKTES